MGLMPYSFIVLMIEMTAKSIRLTYMSRCIKNVYLNLWMQGISDAKSIEQSTKNNIIL
jgi:hypothetical protein